MDFKPTQKLTTLQFVTALLAVIAVGVIGIKHGIDDIPLDLLATLIGIASLIVGLWQEVAKVRHIAEAVSEQRVMDSLKLDDHIADNPEYMLVLQWLLKPPRSGMQAVLRNLILKQAAGDMKYYHLVLDKPGEESSRILALCEVIRKADHYVYACTYGDPSYIIDFWDKPSTLRDYYDAHKEALHNKRGRKVTLQRIFVVTEQLRTNKHAYSVFVRVVQNLRALGMRDIFVVEESEAMMQLGEVPTKSFFVADDEFVSESEAKGVVATGYVTFSGSEAARLKRVFAALRLAAGQAISDDDIQKLRQT